MSSLKREANPSFLYYIYYSYDSSLLLLILSPAHLFSHLSLKTSLKGICYDRIIYEKGSQSSISSGIAFMLNNKWNIEGRGSGFKGQILFCIPKA